MAMIKINVNDERTAKAIFKHMSGDSDYAVIEYNGNVYVLCHGNEQGELNINFAVLENLYNPIILCCYPDAVRNNGFNVHPDLHGNCKVRSVFNGYTLILYPVNNIRSKFSR